MPLGRRCRITPAVKRGGSAGETGLGIAKSNPAARKPEGGRKTDRSYRTMLSRPAAALPRTNDSASLAGMTIPVTA